MRIEPDGIIVILRPVCGYDQDEFNRFSCKTAQIQVHRIELAFIDFMPAAQCFDLPVISVIESEDHITFLGVIPAIHQRAESIPGLHGERWILTLDDAVVGIFGPREQSGFIFRGSVFHLGGIQFDDVTSQITVCAGAGERAVIVFPICTAVIGHKVIRNKRRATHLNICPKGRVCLRTNTKKLARGIAQFPVPAIVSVCIWRS